MNGPQGGLRRYRKAAHPIGHTLKRERNFGYEKL